MEGSKGDRGSGEGDIGVGLGCGVGGTQQLCQGVTIAPNTTSDGA